MDYLALPNQDLNLWWTFRRTHEALHQLRKMEVRAYKISTVETGVLLIVYLSHNKVTPIEIARQLVKDTHSITQLLIRMEKRGLLKRVKDLPRKNMIRVVLTPKGLAAYKKTEGIKTLQKIMSSLTPDEKKQFEETLNKLRNKTVKIIKTYC
jgi:MarR family transcriptional regulator, organic hydroperoxide resistance regulator